MKRIYSIVLMMTVLSMQMRGQTFIDRFEVNAGLNSSTMTWLQSKFGFHAGVRATKNLDKELTKGMYANAGALLSLKGGKMDLGDLGKSAINAYYLDIPVHIGYKYAINDKISVFGEVGPYFDFGLFGNQSCTLLVDDYSLKYEKSTNSSFDVLKRFDFGFGFRVGMDYKKYSTLAFD